jgi:hypothetical protein
MLVGRRRRRRRIAPAAQWILAEAAEPWIPRAAAGPRLMSALRNEYGKLPPCHLVATERKGARQFNHDRIRFRRRDARRTVGRRSTHYESARRHDDHLRAIIAIAKYAARCAGIGRPARRGRQQAKRD